MHKRIGGLPPSTDKAALFAAYGFVAQRVGELNDDRVIDLLKLAPIASNAQSDGGKLPAEWLYIMQNLLGSIEANRPQANIGGRSDAVRDRREALDKADDLISRCHGLLTFALPRRDEDPLMHDYGFTPRRPPVRPKKPTPPV